MYAMIFKTLDSVMHIKSQYGLAAVMLFCALLFGCEEGDPTALKEAVNAADINVTAISVEPAEGTIKTGYSYPFTAVGERPDGATVDVTNSVTWASSNTAIATVNSNGVVSTVTDGSVTISASLAGISGSTTLTASSAVLQSIAVLADTATPNVLSVSACKNLQLKAIGEYADGVRDIIPITDHVTWSVVMGSGEINATNGLLSTFSDGTISVLASLDGVDSATDVTATADLNAITVTPAAQTLAINGTLQYTATGAYNGNGSSTANITNNVEWLSGAPTVADFTNLNSPGLITAGTQGVTAITATCGASVSGTASLTVSDNTLDYLRFEDGNGAEIEVFNTVVGIATQISLYGHFTNDDKVDVTENAQWTLLDGTVGVITVNNSTDNKGIITAVAVGRADVRVAYQQNVLILPVNVTAAPP